MDLKENHFRSACHGLGVFDGRKAQASSHLDAESNCMTLNENHSHFVYHLYVTNSNCLLCCVNCETPNTSQVPAEYCFQPWCSVKKRLIHNAFMDSMSFLDRINVASPPEFQE